MPLTAIAIKALQPRDREFLEPDGGSLYLTVKPSGAKLWRFRFLHNGKQKQLALGAFPLVSLAQAREARDEAKRLIAQGIDPAAEKQARKRPAPPPAPKTPPTLRRVARDYVELRRRSGTAPATADKFEWSMAAIGDALLDTPLADVSKADVLARLRVFEAMGRHEKTLRVRTFLARVYEFAAAEGMDVASPVQGLSKALVAPRATHHAALFQPREVGALLRAIDGYGGEPSTHFALRLAPLTVLRSRELRTLLWRDVAWNDDLVRRASRAHEEGPERPPRAALAPSARGSGGGVGLRGRPARRRPRLPVPPRQRTLDLGKYLYSRLPAHGLRDGRGHASRAAPDLLHLDERGGLEPRLDRGPARPRGGRRRPRRLQRGRLPRGSPPADAGLGRHARHRARLACAQCLSGVASGRRRVDHTLTAFHNIIISIRSQRISASLDPEPLRFMGAKDVTHRIGLSLSTINRYVADGSLPYPHRTGPRRLVWIEGKVVAWMGEVAVGRSPLPGTYCHVNGNEGGAKDRDEGV